MSKARQLLVPTRRGGGPPESVTLTVVSSEIGTTDNSTLVVTLSAGTLTADNPENGWAFEYDDTPVAISGAIISDDEIAFTLAEPITPATVVTGNYTASSGDLLQNGVTVADIAEFAVTNNFAWELNDNFTTAAAAGSIPADAEPGPGTRTVADTGNKLSLAGGSLVDTTSNDWNTGLRYGQYTWSNGKIAVARLQNDGARFNTFLLRSTSTIQTIGLGLPHVGLVSDSLVLQSAGSAYGPKINTWAYNTWFNVAIVLGTNKAYLYVDGILNYIWHLTSYSFYPTLDAVPQSSKIAYCDFCRLAPAGQYLPTAIAFDTFTRSDGALGNTETTGPDGQTISALAWSGNGSISSNKLVTTAGGTAGIDAGDEDILVEVDIVCAASQTAGIRVRLDSASSPADYLDIYLDRTTNTIKVDEVASGSPSNKSSTAFTYSAGKKLRVRLIGTSYYVWYNDTFITNSTTVVAGDTLVGLSSSDTATTFDNFHALSTQAVGVLDDYT